MTNLDVILKAHPTTFNNAMGLIKSIENLIDSKDVKKQYKEKLKNRRTEIYDLLYKNIKAQFGIDIKKEASKFSCNQCQH